MLIVIIITRKNGFDDQDDYNEYDDYDNYDGFDDYDDYDNYNDYQKCGGPLLVGGPFGP